MVGREFVFADLTAKRIAVNAQNLSGAGLIAIVAIQDALDKAFLEFPDCLIE